METSRVGKRGTVVVPVKLRKRFGLKEGDLLVTEEREDGILLRPAVAVPVEIYTPERKAEFLLNSAITQEEYDEVYKAVQEMGLDPQKIPNTDPNMRRSLMSDETFRKKMAARHRNSAKKRIHA